MKKVFELIGIRSFVILSLSFVGGFATAIKAQSCEGRVYLKSGERVVYAGDDRLEMPRKKRNVEVYRNFFSRQCQRSEIAYDDVDSVEVWNAAAPDNVRTLVPITDVGWCWTYVNHPRIQVYIYSSQGYSMNAMGGMKAWQDNTIASVFLIPSKTACDFYVLQPHGEPLCLGDVYKRCDKSFVRRLCQYAGISQTLEQKLVKSGEVNRSTMIQMVVSLLDGDAAEME